jgi:hypothetical protein
MISSNSSEASIEASLGKPNPDYTLLRTVIDNVYKPMSSKQFDTFLEEARSLSRDLFLYNPNEEFISLLEWFDQVTAEKPDKNFISRLTNFSTKKMNESLKDLVGFFKLDRFCELRSMFAALKKFPEAYLSRPNSKNDSQKIDLILNDSKNRFGIQVKSAKAKKTKTAGLKVLERVKDLDLNTLVSSLVSLAA